MFSNMHSSSRCLFRSLKDEKLPRHGTLSLELNGLCALQIPQPQIRIAIAKHLVLVRIRMYTEKYEK